MKNKKLIINIFRLVLAFIVFESMSIFRLIPIKILSIYSIKITNTINYLATFFAYICGTLILILIYRKELNKEWKNFKANINKNMDIALKYYFIGLSGMIVCNLILNVILKFGQSQNENAVQDMIKQAPIIMLICAGFLAPITEEITFRKAFKNVFSNKWLFTLISGLVFGSLHVLNFELKTPLELLYILPYFSLGASFAYMDYEIDSTHPSIFMHILHNCFVTILSIIVNFH